MSEPIEGLARTYTSVYINQSLQARAEIMVDLTERFQVDGIVFHSNRSCKPYSLGQYDLRRIISERTSKPGLIIGGRHVRYSRLRRGAIEDQDPGVYGNAGRAKSGN